jgi:hypothetical protein
MKRVAFALACLLISTALIAAEEADQIVADKEFSMSAPKDWKVQDFAGMKYKIAAGPAKDGFAPNIVIIDEAYEGTLADYVKANLVTLAKALPKYAKVSEEEFKTDGGSAMTRVICTNEQNNQKLRQSFFFLDGPAGKKFVVTCSSLLADGEAHDKDFLEAATTFKLLGK